MNDKTKPIIGIIGTGRLGNVVAKQSLKAGYLVRIANSKSPESLSLIIKVLLPGAQASTVHDVIQLSDIIVLAIPMGKYKTLQPELFRDKIVIDAMNYWPPTEGYIEEFTNNTLSTSEFMQSYLTDAKIVKTLNHIAYNELEEHSLPQEDPNRRAIVLAGNNTQAKLHVTRFLNDLGFDPVDLGDLSEGKKFQPDTKLFNARYTAKEIERVYDSRFPETNAILRHTT